MGNIRDRIPVISETLTISSAAVSLTVNIYGNITGSDIEAEVYVETAQIRFDFSPGNPATGGAVEAGQNFMLYNETEIKNVRMIRGGSTDATVRVLYFKTSKT